MAIQASSESRPLIVSGIVLGLGLGGFIDGILLHQILQWHHLLTVPYPPTSVGNLELNTLWDGLFHALTYVLTLAGLLLLWRALRRTDVCWSTRILLGCLLAGWGIFNLVEGVIDHLLLEIHHVRDDLPPGPAQLTWDLGFLVFGALLLVSGWLLIRAGQRATRRS
ncbi:MAG TPA: DUF2243 domain-containing protein [Herpetosiphonaceae bacterium]